MAEHLVVPGAGDWPAPGPRPVPAASLDAIAERYTDLLEAREAQDWFGARALEATLVDEIPTLQDEIYRLQLLRAELAAEIDRINALPCAYQHHQEVPHGA